MVHQCVYRHFGKFTVYLLLNVLNETVYNIVEVLPCVQADYLAFIQLVATADDISIDHHICIMRNKHLKLVVSAWFTWQIPYGIKHMGLMKIRYIQ